MHGEERLGFCSFILGMGYSLKLVISRTGLCAEIFIVYKGILFMVIFFMLQLFFFQFFFSFIIL